MMRGDDGSRRRRLHRAESSEATAAKGYRAPQTHRGTPRKRHHRLRFGRVWVFGDVLEGLSLDVDAKFAAHADAGFGEGVRGRRDDGARAPREATHRRGFDVQREAHAALEEKLLANRATVPSTSATSGRSAHTLATAVRRCSCS